MTGKDEDQYQYEKIRYETKKENGVVICRHINVYSHNFGLWEEGYRL